MLHKCGALVWLAGRDLHVHVLHLVGDVGAVDDSRWWMVPIADVLVGVVVRKCRPDLCASRHMHWLRVAVVVVPLLVEIFDPDKRPGRAIGKRGIDARLAAK